MRVVIDANVVIAAAASRGLCEAILELCLEHHHLIFCEGILAEIGEKLALKLKVSPLVVAEYMKVLRHNAQILEPEHVEKSACRDPDDLMVLGLVTPGNADVIITGDKDLLVLKKYRRARIMTPRSFWESNRR
ncbi:MAG: putative toxin-antitoxin system toxin component, PIN family [Kiritimatiellae bacterium]|nr:putative toxin-antitoxin system toxin component, PIN family [Kiritimatiellia bacterium]